MNTMGEWNCARKYARTGWRGTLRLQILCSAQMQRDSSQIKSYGTAALLYVCRWNTQPIEKKYNFPVINDHRSDVSPLEFPCRLPFALPLVPARKTFALLRGMK